MDRRQEAGEKIQAEGGPKKKREKDKPRSGIGVSKGKRREERKGNFIL